MVKQTANFDGMILYQIYPRSFKDSDGDGVGDLAGIAGKLAYLSDTLGVNTIWISPLYKSPMADFGYDIADHCAVDPLFGTMADFDELLNQAHQRNLRVMIDFVPNHTSVEPPWFKESRSSRSSPKRDWYIWRDANADGSPPNNWRGAFGGSAWDWDEATSQFYLHTYLKQQPDLNWDNEEVRRAMHGVMRFWLDKGVDGLRIDAPTSLSRQPGLPDNPTNPNYNPTINGSNASPLLAVNSQNGPHLFQYLEELAAVIKSYPARHMVLEIYPDANNPTEYYDEFYQRIDPAVSAPFNFELIEAPWDAAAYRKLIDSFEGSLHKNYAGIYCLGNHDRPRLASRIGIEGARSAAILALTLPGVPVIYNGDELGMVNGEIARKDLRDPFALNDPRAPGRDPERTPLAWNDGKSGGFSSGRPWLPLNSDYETVNVSSELRDPDSFLNLYRRLLDFRKKSKALSMGSYKSIDTGNDNVYGFEREFNGERLVVLLNFSAEPQRIKLDGRDALQVELSSARRASLAFSSELLAYESVIVRA